MSGSLTHEAVATAPDDGTGRLGSAEWNAPHKASGPGLIGRTAAGAGPVAVIGAGPGLVLAGGELRGADRRDRAELFTDFFTTAPMNAYNTGTGAGTAIGTNVPAIAGAIGCGVIACNTGSTAAGRAGVIWPTANPSANNVFAFGAYAHEFETRAALASASDGTETFSVRLGFAEDPAIVGGDTILFHYDPAGYSDANWRAICRTNGTSTVQDTGVAPTPAVFQRMRIDVAADGAIVVFAIDSVTVATITTNIPTGAARSTGIGATILKSVGTTSRALYLDYIYAAMVFPSGRPTA